MKKGKTWFIYIYFKSKLFFFDLDSYSCMLCLYRQEDDTDVLCWKRTPLGKVNISTRPKYSVSRISSCDERCLVGSGGDTEQQELTAYWPSPSLQQHCSC